MDHDCACLVVCFCCYYGCCELSLLLLLLLLLLLRYCSCTSCCGVVWWFVNFLLAKSLFKPYSRRVVRCICMRQGTQIVYGEHTETTMTSCALGVYRLLVWRYRYFSTFWVVSSESRLQVPVHSRVPGTVFKTTQNDHRLSRTHITVTSDD